MFRLVIAIVAVFFSNTVFAANNSPVHKLNKGLELSCKHLETRKNLVVCVPMERVKDNAGKVVFGNFGYFVGEIAGGLINWKVFMGVTTSRFKEGDFVSSKSADKLYKVKLLRDIEFRSSLF